MFGETTGPDLVSPDGMSDQMLGGGRMRLFLKACQSNFDLVVIDGSPVMAFSDAPQLANAVAGTILILEAGRTRRDLAKTAIQRLRLGRVRLLGAVLSKFDLRKAGYGFGHAYGYGYGYGAGFEYGMKPQAPRKQIARSGVRRWLNGKQQGSA